MRGASSLGRQGASTSSVAEAQAPFLLFPSGYRAGPQDQDRLSFLKSKQTRCSYLSSSVLEKQAQDFPSLKIKFAFVDRAAVLL